MITDYAQVITVNTCYVLEFPVFVHFVQTSSKKFLHNTQNQWLFLLIVNTWILFFRILNATSLSLILHLLLCIKPCKLLSNCKNHIITSQQRHCTARQIADITQILLYADCGMHCIDYSTLIIVFVRTCRKHMQGIFDD